MNRRETLKAFIAVPVIAAIPWYVETSPSYFRLTVTGLDGRVIWTSKTPIRRQIHPDWLNDTDPDWPKDIDE
jgi:hypothetical protein